MKSPGLKTINDFLSEKGIEWGAMSEPLWIEWELLGPKYSDPIFAALGLSGECQEGIAQWAKEIKTTKDLLKWAAQ